MNVTRLHRAVALSLVLGCLLCAPLAAQEADKPKSPDKIYVPYDKLKGVFESETQGVFLPYKEFQRLWQAATGAPAGVIQAPAPYLISKAQFAGTVGKELAEIQLELTVDILADGWVEVPIGLGEVAIAKAAFAEPTDKTPLLLRVVKGRYLLVTKGKGRRVLKLDFVRQLETKPGLNILSFRMPSAAISKLDLLIPEENMKVDVSPMLAATTSQETVDGTKATRLQTFLGSAEAVRLSWKPKTQAAAELAPVIISDQFQHINVAEALITHEVKFTYDIRRRGVDSFTIQLPPDFRVVSVTGDNISKWDIVSPTRVATPPALQVKLFSPVKDRYALSVKMERFLKDADATIPIVPIITQQVLRRTGLIAITHSPRRSVEVQEPGELARVDTGRLPKELRSSPGVTAHRFISADYSGKLAIGTVSPRITARHLWALGVSDDRLELSGQLHYTIERVGVFRLETNLPEPWEIVSVGPANLVDDHQLKGSGATRKLHLLLKKEISGNVRIDLVARAPRPAPDADVNFDLPLADATDVQLYSGQLVLYLAGRLRAEVAELNQLQSLPLSRRQGGPGIGGLATAMAFEFRAVDRARPAGATFRIAVRPAQVSAIVHRLVNIQAGSVEQEARIQYNVLYAPVDTFYLKMPASLADAGVQITGVDIKEKPRIDKLPADQIEKATTAATQPAAPAPATKPVAWAYYKIVLQSPVLGRYDVRVSARRAFQAAQVGQAVTVPVEPILAAGTLSDQSGHIAVAKAETLAIVEPVIRNLDPADPSSATDLPYAPHRKAASLAFRYSRPPFELSLPVVAQKEAAVFTTIATAAVVEQVIARDGRLNAHAVFLLATSKGDRLPIRMPAGSKLLAVLLNGSEVPVELGATADERIVRLPPSAGQVTKLVLEIAYSLDEASAWTLVAPALPDDIPVQQTLWRLWVPDEEYLLHFDRNFSRLVDGERLLRSLAAGQPAPVTFTLSPQGRAWDFVRQGPPGELSVLLIGIEVFNITVWILVAAGGIAMLKLGGFRRCLILLGVGFLAAVLRLFSPLLVRNLVYTAAWAAVLVLGLWIAQWLFLRLPGLLKQIAANSPPKPPGKPKRPAKPAPAADAPETEARDTENKE